MILFDILTDILHKKQGNILQTVENEAEVSPYMLNRWLSMYSPDVTKIVNVTNNRWWSTFQNKQDWYKFNLCVLPRCRFKKIEYLKKGTSVKKSEEDDGIIFQSIANNLELSVREVKSYIEENNIDISSFKKVLKNGK